MNLLPLRSAAFLSLFALAVSWTSPAGAQGPLTSDHGPSPHGASPHAGTGGPRQILSITDPTLPAGTLVVEVLDEEGRPLPGVMVQLVEQFQSVAQGNQTTAFKKDSSEAGTAEFTDLKVAMRFSYSVTVLREGAEYVVPAFRFNKTGRRVRVPTYPTTHELTDGFVGMRGFNYVQLRADVVKVDVMYRIINMGKKAWIPKDVFLALPPKATGVDVGTAGASGFKKMDQKVALTGSYPPGQKDVQFTFQLENTNTETRNIKIGVLPHTAELRVLSDLVPNLTLNVSPAFDSPQSADGPSGKKVLITRRLMQPGQDELTEVSITLGGLPVTGPGRWIALSIALLLFLLALFGIFKKRPEEDLLGEKSQARQTLLAEMLLLEGAFEAENIGPRTYEQTKREILLALARLETKPAS